MCCFGVRMNDEESGAKKTPTHLNTAKPFFSFSTLRGGIWFALRFDIFYVLPRKDPTTPMTFSCFNTSHVGLTRAIGDTRSSFFLPSPVGGWMHTYSINISRTLFVIDSKRESNPSCTIAIHLSLAQNLSLSKLDFV